MLTVGNKNPWKAKLEREKKKIKSTATVYVQKKTLQVFKFVLERTPQYTSDLVTSWGIEVGAGAASFGYSQHPDKGKENALYMPGAFMSGGFDPVNSEAEYGRNWKRMYELAKVRVQFIKYNNKIAIVNNSPTAGLLQSTVRSPPTFRPITYDLVKDSETVLSGSLWNIRSVTIMRFKYLA